MFTVYKVYYPDCWYAQDFNGSLIKAVKYCKKQNKVDKKYHWVVVLNCN